jgi:hypothetical protein
LKGGDTSGNIDVEDTATEESNNNQNQEIETLVEEKIENPACKSLSRHINFNKKISPLGCRSRTSVANFSSKYIWGKFHMIRKHM